MACSYPDYASIPIPPPQPAVVKLEAAEAAASALPPLPSSSSSRLEGDAGASQSMPARRKDEEGFVSEDGTVTFQGHKINILELQAEVVGCLQVGSLMHQSKTYPCHSNPAGGAHTCATRVVADVALTSASLGCCQGGGFCGQQSCLFLRMLQVFQACVSQERTSAC